MVCIFVRGFNLADKQCNLQELNSTKEQLTKTEKELKIKSENILNLIEEKNELRLAKLKIEKQLKELEDSLKPDPNQVHYDNKYEKKIILYNGRTFGPTKEIIPIDVRTLLTPDDYYVQKIVSDNNLQIQEPEIHVPAIYKFIKNNYYSYKHDIDNYGIPEHWEFFFEMFPKVTKGVGQDCDGWGIFQANLYRAAGLPSWKIRLAAGECSQGGHLTCYVFSEVLQKFVNLNSTYGNYLPMKLSKYPTTDDAYSGKDKLGIKNVWFCFNDQFAWSQLYDTATEARFKEQRVKGSRRRKFIVKPYKE